MKQILMVWFFFFLSITAGNASKSKLLCVADQSKNSVVDVAEPISAKANWSNKVDRYLALTKHGFASVADKVKSVILMARTYSGTPLHIITRLMYT